MHLAFPKNIDQYFILRWLTSWWILNVAYLYKCWVSRTDCSICHYDSTAEPYLKCGWCKADTNKCVVQEACNEVGGFWIPYSLPCRTKPNITKVLERWLLGTLRSNDATANKNVALRVILRSFSLYRDYAYPLTLSNVGEPSWSWILRDHIQVEKEN